LNTGIRNHNNIKIIVPKELKLKKPQKVIGKPITPNCQLKWDTFYEKQLSGNILFSFLVSFSLNIFGCTATKEDSG
jgi:hypothetical protein